jgi:hypothetical protein
MTRTHGKQILRVEAIGATGVSKGVRNPGRHEESS